MKIPKNIVSVVRATPSLALVPLSYRITLENYEPILILYFLPSLILILAEVIIGHSTISHLSKFHFSTHATFGLCLFIVWALISILNFPATTYFRVKAVRSKSAPTVVQAYRHGFRVYFKVYLAQLIFLVLIGIGLILLIVPGVLLFRRYCFVSYYAAEHPDWTIKQIFTEAAKDTKPYAYYIYGTFGILLIVEFIFATLGNSLTTIGVVSNILTYLIGYALLFLPVLRYKEITDNSVFIKTVKFYGKKEV